MFPRHKFISAVLACLTLTVGAQPAQIAPTAPVHVVLNANGQAALGVQVTTVKAASGGQVLASATVTTPPARTLTVSAPYAGQISRLWVGVGDAVKSGASLAQFTSPQLGDARRALNEATLAYKNAAAAAQRDQAMLDEGIIPAVRLQLSRSKEEAAQSELQARQSEIASAGIRFDNAPATSYATGTLKAPIAGTVVQAYGSVGQRVEAGTLLFKLADASQLQLDIQLSSDKASQLQAGDLVSIPSHNASGKILGVSRAVDATQSARARAVVTQMGSLKLGELVSVTLHAQSKLAAGKPGTQWLVPSQALTQWHGKPWIFIATGQGFAAHAVQVLSSSDDVSLVEVALPVDAKVAITGVTSLRALLQKDE
jgi:membrane fusion protein, heavy metal efflux system